MNPYYHANDAILTYGQAYIYWHNSCCKHVNAFFHSIYSVCIVCVSNLHLLHDECGMSSLHLDEDILIV